MFALNAGFYEASQGERVFVEVVDFPIPGKISSFPLEERNKLLTPSKRFAKVARRKGKYFVPPKCLLPQITSETNHHRSMNTTSMSTSLKPQSIHRKSFSTLFAAAVAAGLSAASVMAQGYYPPSNSPIDGNPDLLNIESRFTVVAPTATLRVPPLPGFHVATDAEIALALGASLTDELDGTPVGGGVSLAGLVGEISKYRPAKTGNWATTAVTKILAQPNLANIPADLETASASASAPNPKGAPGVVKNAIKLIATVGSLTDGNADDIVEQAIIDASTYADKIVAGAMGSAKKVDAVDLPGVMQDITSEAIQEAVAAGASYLIEEIMFAAEKGRAGVSVADIAAAAFKFRATHPVTPGGATGIALTQEDAAAVAGYAMRGSGVAEVSNVVAGVNTGTASAFSAYVTKVGEGFTTASVSSDALVSAPAVVASINAGNANFIPAILTGGISWLNRNSTGVIAGALSADDTFSGTASTQDIVQAAVRVVQKDAAKVAKAALVAVNVNITRHDIAQGASSGTTAAIIGAVTSTLIKGGPITQTNVEDIVDGAIDGAVASGKNGAIVDVAFQASKAAGGAGFSDEATVRAVLSSPAGDAYRAVAGGVAGNKKSNAAIKAAALAARGDDDDVANAFAADTVIAIQLTPKAFFNITLQKLADVNNTALIDTQAIATGAGAANPKGVTAIVAAAIANTSFSAVAIVDAVKQTNRKLAFSIDLSANAASHVKASTADLFDYVNHTTFQNPKFAADVATGATVAAPQYAHIVGHASAFAAPQTAGKSVPALFAYSQLDNPLAPNIVNPVAAAAAISAGVTCGILEAKTTVKELGYLKAAVSAAVKASLALQSGSPTFSQMQASGSPSLVTEKGAAGVVTGYVAMEVTAGDTTIDATTAAVITAAVKAGKAFALEIAQAAGQAARSVSGAYTNAAAIQAAVTAAGPAFSPAQVLAAVNYGISQAAAFVAGAGAAGVVNYTHVSCTGAPVTSIFDL